MISELQYEVIKKPKLKNPRIDVSINGVQVILPEGSGMDPEEFIEDKCDWIEEKVQKFQKHRERIPDRSFEEGESWPFLGEQKTLVVNGIHYHQVNDDRIELAEKRVENTSIREELEKFYRREARSHITDLVDRWASMLNVDYDKLYIRNQRTKWASCSDKGNISFNFRLMMAPPEIIEYIVIHELCHLIQPNHGPKFDRLLNQHCPDHQEKAEWLNEKSVELIFSADDL